MAIGARSGDILRQFLIESVVLSCVGGAIGLLLGTTFSVAATYLINTYGPANDFPLAISFPWLSSSANRT